MSVKNPIGFQKIRRKLVFWGILRSVRAEHLIQLQIFVMV